MGLWLIFPGEVQVDIGNLVPFKAEECFKWYVMTVFTVHGATVRALLIGKVIATSDRTVGKKFGVMAVRTNIMGLKWIDFGNLEHRRDKRRANGTTATDEIAILHRFFNKFVRDQINNRKPVPDDTI